MNECARCKAPKEPQCIHHSGKPIFHDGLKGYSCCQKRVVDFDDFLKIPGCCSSENHLEIGAKETNSVNSKAGESEKLTVKQEDKKEIPNGNVLIPTQIAKPIEKKIQNDPEGFEPQIGMKCTRPGCSYKFDGDPNDCNFHSGIPVFHEGSKGYSCCKRKVLEFDEFLKIKGCKIGQHMYTEDVKPTRFDWYQSLHTVHVSIFAKNVKQEACKCDIKETRVSIKASNLYFDVDLFQEICPSESKLEILKSKVELTLKKKSGMSWPSLEVSANSGQIYTTFGAAGSGTIGGKDIKVANPTISRVNLNN
eukprot:NODE_188_length_13518_cov_0.721142.p8 type:complete len:307 gc:universal NODE_188_length_13518_cov_0.721142:4329-5249(+)